MPDDTPILSLPLIQPAQAQKHVTHNEALRILDVAVQLAVKNRDLAAPPALPAVGDRHIVAAGASGDWAGQAGRVAVFMPEGWQFFAPLTGWRAWVQAEEQMAVFDGTGWALLAEGPVTAERFGVNTTANVNNRLAVSAPATLLSHEGAGHQLKVNKATGGDTASLLFQVNWSGRAEMGLAGNNDFSVKVSADGAAFQTALQADAGSGVISLPQGLRAGTGSAGLPGIGFEGDVDTGLFRAGANQIGFSAGGVSRAVLGTAGLQLDVPVTGGAVQPDGADALPGLGLLLASGMGNTLSHKGRIAAGADLNAICEPGVYRVGTAADAATILNLPDTYAGGMLEVLTQGATGSRGGFGLVMQRYTMRRTAAGAPRVWLRQNDSASAASWGSWTELLTQHALLGTVAQAAGVPTGAVIERGANANGEYVRYADGTQICTRIGLSATNASTALGSVFRSADVTWSYPLVFVAAPVVSGSVDNSDCWLTTGTPGVASCVVRALAGASKSSALALRLMAVGRWV